MRGDVDVVVVGGGIGGLAGALALGRLGWRVRVLECSAEFTEVGAGLQLAPNATRILGDWGVLDRVTAAGFTPRRAALADAMDGEELTHLDLADVTERYGAPYLLVYALGSGTDTRGGVLGTGSRAYTTETTGALRKRLLDGSGSVAVVGGGLTGIELAAELAESYPDWRVRLLTAGEIGAGLSGKGRSHVRSALDALGVGRHEGHRVGDADQVDADQVDADQVDADVVVWAAAMTATTGLAARAGLALDATGRVLVDPTLRSRTHPDVYVAGDAAAASTPDGDVLRMACATAMPTGPQAAAAISAELRGIEPRPLRFGYLLQCIGLGRRDGLVQFVRPTTRHVTASSPAGRLPGSRRGSSAPLSASCPWPAVTLAYTAWSRASDKPREPSCSPPTSWFVYRATPPNATRPDASPLGGVSLRTSVTESAHNGPRCA